MYPPSAPSPPPSGFTGGAGAGAASGKGITILVLGIVGLVCCPLAAPVAGVMGHLELKAIQAGAAPPGNHAVAQIGMVLGVLGSVLLGFALLWAFAFGGLAAMSVLLNS